MNHHDFLDKSTLERLGLLLKGEPQDIVIVCHVSPDGDAVGSSLALRRVLRNMGHRPQVVTPDIPPKTLQFLPDVEEIIPASMKPHEAEKLINNASTIFCLDFNALMRIDRLEDTLRNAPAKKVLIDHHLDPEDFAEIKISAPQLPATCMLLYIVLSECGALPFLDKDAATCLLAGILTDTGGLAFNSNNPLLYSVIGDLIALGVDKDALFKRLFDTNTESRLRICGYALYRKMEILRSHRAAVITLSMDELRDMNYVKGDTESLVNQPLSLPEVSYSIFLRQDNDSFVKISCRSKGDVPVNILCEKFFGGGGHKNAAGGEFLGSLDDCLAIVNKAIDFMDRYTIENEQDSK